MGTRYRYRCEPFVRFETFGARFTADFTTRGQYVVAGRGPIIGTSCTDEVPEHAHRRALVEGGFHFQGQGDILDKELRQTEAHGGEVWGDLLHRPFAEVVVVPHNVEQWDLQPRHRVDESRDYRVPQLVGNLERLETRVGIDKFFANVPGSIMRKA